MKYINQMRLEVSVVRLRKNAVCSAEEKRPFAFVLVLGQFQLPKASFPFHSFGYLYDIYESIPFGESRFTIPGIDPTLVRPPSRYCNVSLSCLTEARPPLMASKVAATVVATHLPITDQSQVLLLLRESVAHALFLGAVHRTAQHSISPHT